MAEPLTAPDVADARLGSDAPFLRQLLSLTQPAERPYYEVGVLLDRDDFIAEQAYHRARLARALASLFGHGTIAGLRVREPLDPDDPTRPLRPNAERELEVEPGLALDRLGRLIELRSAQCFRVRRWFDWALEHDPDALLEAAVGPAGGQTMALDIFVRFVVCQHGATPAFATGPFNATDATVPAREHDAFELAWALRPAAEAATVAVNAWPAADRVAQALAALPDGTPQERAARDRRRAELVGEAILGAWEPLAADSSAPALRPLVEQPLAGWWDRVLLARVTIPVSVAAARVQLDEARELAIDNLIRPFVYVPGRWQGGLRL
jgi:hypothetical protein